MNKIISLYKKCNKSGCNFLIVFLKYVYYRLIGKNILACQRTKIKGIKNIQTGGLLKIGIEYVGTTLSSDRTYLNIAGSAVFRGKYSIGRGCRLDISAGAVLRVGNGGFITANTLFILKKGLTIGDDCAISWNCQFLDSDFHAIQYQNQVRPDNTEEIIIGNHVWIGCNTKIYKGTFISNGSVIAADSSVRGVFDEPDVLIAGNPAKIIKRNIKWY